jgi:hypothetical protein
MEEIPAERWERFAHDVNAEVLGWRKHAQLVQWTTRLLVLAGLVCGITSAPLFLQSRRDNADTSERRVVAAVALASFSLVCLVVSVLVVCSGATMERSARSDLIAVLDWFSDETEVDHLSFELVKSCEQDVSHGGEQQMRTSTQEEGRSSRKLWLPIVNHYYIKVVVRGMCVDADGASTCSSDEFGSESEDAVNDAKSNGNREIGSLEEPLLTSVERNSA